MTSSCHKNMYIDRQHSSRKAERGNLRLKYENILKVWWAIFISVPNLLGNNAAMRLPNLIDGVPRYGMVK